MLIGGGVLFALIVLGVIVALQDGKPPADTAATVTVPKEKPVAAKVVHPAAQRSESAIAGEAEAIAGKFLEATRVEEILPLVRNPELAEARIRNYYADGKIAAPGLSQFNTGGSAFYRGAVVSYSVRTRSQEQKSLAFMDGPAGMKIDWESWVGWSEVSWKSFTAARSTTTGVFRLNLSAVEYYNFQFKDDLKWQSYRLESPDQETSLYGYVEKGSLLDKQLRPGGDVKSQPLMLSLRYPDGASSPNQVLIERLVTEGWVEESEKP